MRSGGKGLRKENRFQATGPPAMQTTNGIVRGFNQQELDQQASEAATVKQEKEDREEAKRLFNSWPEWRQKQTPLAEVQSNIEKKRILEQVKSQLREQHIPEDQINDGVYKLGVDLGLYSGIDPKTGARVISDPEHKQSEFADFLDSFSSSFRGVLDLGKNIPGIGKYVSGISDALDILPDLTKNLVGGKIKHNPYARYSKHGRRVHKSNSI